MPTQDDFLDDVEGHVEAELDTEPLGLIVEDDFFEVRPALMPAPLSQAQRPSTPPALKGPSWKSSAGV